MNSNLVRGALLVLMTTGLAMIALPQKADAFCGFYVSGATGELFNNATQVVMMRDGMRTVLAMQNNYQGPPEDFAMVVPVPVVLQKDNVKTLSHEVFKKVDQMAAPRLVEYWEQDPCYVPPRIMYKTAEGMALPAPGAGVPTMAANGVKVEAQFKVAEYEIVILSANDSSGLDKWLRANKYKIPEGAAGALRPYVEQGTKFFVAKVDSKKVKFKNDKAVLSPLRFHYDSKDFSLPVRLGLLNANGPQDVIVHILAAGQRYEVANYKNATIPTNLKVDDDTEKRFAEFYAALFDETLRKNPGAVVTEYSWAASTCDPCPGPTLTRNDFVELGMDDLPNVKQHWNFVLTRLHARYTKDSLSEDLVFKAAPPMIGGRGTPNPKGVFTETGAKPGSVNNFQGRYAMLHPWEGKIECQEPVRGRWGGPPNKSPVQPKTAQGLAEAKRGQIQLARYIREDVPEIGLKSTNLQPPIGEEKPKGQKPADPSKPEAKPPTKGDPKPASDKTAPAEEEGCTITAPRGTSSSPWWISGLILLGLVRRRKT